MLEPPEDGWYDTGDIVSVDAAGFVTIVGRAKRFAKIGGEMVSMTAAEALVASLWPDAQHAVISLPDPRKGESLLLVTNRARCGGQGDPGACAQARMVPEIMVPRAILCGGVGAAARHREGRLSGRPAHGRSNPQHAGGIR